MTENYPNLVKGQEVEQTPNEINLGKSKPRCHVKFLKTEDKEKHLETSGRERGFGVSGGRKEGGRGTAHSVDQLDVNRFLT